MNLIHIINVAGNNYTILGTIPRGFKALNLWNEPCRIYPTKDNITIVERHHQTGRFTSIKHKVKR